jgi:4-aminobutyrate aminotransferase
VTENGASGWLARDAASVASVFHRYSDLVIASGEGSYLVDVDGKRYLDMTTGIGVTSLGHAHPRVVAAAQEQLTKLTHVSVTAHHELNVRLAERLAQVTAPGLDVSFFANSGAEAVDGAVKLARRVLGRTDVVAFRGGFHGRTLMATSLTTSREHYRKGYDPLVPGVHFLPYPSAGHDGGEAALAGTRQALADLLTEVSPATIAAVIVEPVLGEGGYIVPPAGLLGMLRQAADEHGFLLIADEVQSGMGRTGRWFAHEHSDVTPDVLLVAKALGNGLPISAIVAGHDLMDAWPPGAHGSTYGGNPVCCAAAIATIDTIDDEGLVARAATLGAQALATLQDGVGEHPAVADIRGQGLMIGVELRAVGGHRTAAAVQENVRAACLADGVLVISCGSQDEVIRLIPALNMPDADLEMGLGAVTRAIQSLPTG